MKKQGLFIVYTDNDKGKTTAALGQALRAIERFRVPGSKFKVGKTYLGSQP